MRQSHTALPVPSLVTHGLALRWRVRLLPAALLAVTIPVLVSAFFLAPDPSGLGTAEQIGIACGFYNRLALPCATCGYTTAFAWAAQGHLVQAFAVQPAGAALAVVTAAMMIIAGYALANGLSIGPLIQWMWRPKPIIFVIVIILGAWVYKIVIVSRHF